MPATCYRETSTDGNRAGTVEEISVHLDGSFLVQVDVPKIQDACRSRRSVLLSGAQVGV